MKILQALLPLSLLLPVAALADSTPAWLVAGDPIPEGQLLTVEGDAVALDSLVEEGPAILIFYRGGWCPYCQRHLVELAGIEDELTGLGYRIYAISPDRPEVLRGFEGADEVGYTLLSDKTMTVSYLFGLAFEVPGDTVAMMSKDYGIDIEGASGEKHHLLPHPALYVVGKDGRIDYAHVNPDYKERLSGEDVLAAAKAARQQ